MVSVSFSLTSSRSSCPLSIELVSLHTSTFYPLVNMLYQVWVLYCCCCILHDGSVICCIRSNEELIFFYFFVFVYLESCSFQGRIRSFWTDHVQYLVHRVLSYPIPEFKKKIITRQRFGLSGLIIQSIAAIVQDKTSFVDVGGIFVRNQPSDAWREY